MNHLLAIKKFFRTSTAHLALSYLVIIMLMSFCFSFVFYQTSWHELGRQVPSPDSYGYQHSDDYLGSGLGIDDFFRQRIAEGRHELFIRLMLLNLWVLFAGGLLSYYLARRTLAPIEANMEAQTQFVSDASHELRTPLTALQTMNEVALRKKKISPQEAQETFKNNVAEVVRLRQLTDSLLHLAKNDGNTSDFSELSLPSVVSEAMNSVMPHALQKKIAIEDAIPNIKLRGDQKSLTQAVIILLDNAIKFSPKKSTIHLTAAAQNRHIVLQVRDEGIGIKAEHLPHIFDRFYRVDDARSKQHYEGFGIGLALAKKIIEQHGGDISAESQPKKGSVFTIKLPKSLGSLT